MTTLVHSPLKAIELVGTVGKDHLLRTYRPLPLPEHTQVRIIVLYPESEELEPLTDEEFEALTDEFRFKLDTAGYDTEEKLIELVQDVKREIAQERYGAKQ